MATSIDSKLAACDPDTLALLYSNTNSYGGMIYCAIEIGDKIILYHQSNGKIYVHDTKDQLKVVATISISNWQFSLGKIDDTHFLSGGINGSMNFLRLDNNNLQLISSPNLTEG